MCVCVCVSYDDLNVLLLWKKKTELLKLLILIMNNFSSAS